MTPEERKYEETKTLMPNIKKSFKLIKKLNLADKAQKKKALIWKDVIEELNSTNVEDNMMKIEEQEEMADFVKPSNKFNFEDEEQETSFNPTTPIISFRKMINYNKEDLVSKALLAMTNYVGNKLTFSVTEEAYKHLSECAG